MGTLAGNLSIKHQHPEFPSDIYLVFEALDVQVIIQESKQVHRTVTVAEYLKATMTKKVIKSFILKPYNKDEYIFDSYKVRYSQIHIHTYTRYVCRRYSINYYLNNRYFLFVDYATSSKCSCLCECCHFNSD